MGVLSVSWVKIFFGFASEKIVRGFLTSQRTRPYRKSPGLLLTLNIEQCSPNNLNQSELLLMRL